MNNLPTGTVTFLFTDIEGSTKIAQQYPQQWETLRARHHALLHQAMQAHNGFVFQIIGDAFCVAFHTAIDALNAAVLAQRLFLQEPWSPAQIKVRIGINTGTAQVSSDDPRSGGYTGYASLVRVQRVMSVAYGGQILLSNASMELVRLELPQGLRLLDLKEHRLKGLLNPEHLWQVAAPDLPQDFPPLQSLNAIPNNLPIQLTSFVGREQEMARVKELLNGTRLVSLTGAGGAGKTRLSLQVAADLIDEFPDGVWFVELASLTDPGLIPQTVAAILGLREETGRPVMSMLSDYLRAKTSLLILDNCEHLIDACAKFADAILHAASKVKILATSREALGIAGETAYRVPSLSLPPQDLRSASRDFGSLTQYEAVRLFVDRALAVQPDFSVTNANAPAVAQICHRLDGIPLALELAAARIKSLSVEQIAARLDDRFRLLTGGSRTALPRQQTLRALIDWSYSLLTEAERVLLRRLSVFAGGWTLDASQAVCGCDPVCADDVLDLLARLVDKSLVIFEQRDNEARYRMMETIRQYARDRLLESSEGETIRDRHLDFFVAYAEEAEPQLRGAEQFQWLDQLEVEHDNLRAALEWSQGQGRVQRGLRLAGALTTFWHMRAYSSEGRRCVDSLLAQTDAAEKTLIRAKVLFAAAISTGDLGDFKAVCQYLEEAIAVAREHGQTGKRLLALTLAELSFTLQSEQQSRAQALEDESGSLARELGDKWVSATLLHYQGHRFQTQNDLKSARVAFEESMRLFNSEGDKRWATVLFRDIAGLNFRERDYATARRQHEEALSFFRELKDRQLVASELNTLGEIARTVEDYSLAKKYYDESLAIALELGQQFLVRVVMGNLGAIVLRLGDAIQARNLFEEALNSAREAGRNDQVVGALAGFAFVAVVQNETQRAIQLLAAIDSLSKLSAVPHLNPADESEIEHYLSLARAQLDDAMFNVAWAEGQKMTMEQAIELAMKEVGNE